MCVCVCVCVCVDVCLLTTYKRVWTLSEFRKRVGARGAPGREQHLTRKKKVGKQDATLTQETGAIGDCLHCYPINRP